MVCEGCEDSGIGFGCICEKCIASLSQYKRALEALARDERNEGLTWNQLRTIDRALHPERWPEGAPDVVPSVRSVVPPPLVVPGGPPLTPSTAHAVLSHPLAAYAHHLYLDCHEGCSCGLDNLTKELGLPKNENYPT